MKAMKRALPLLAVVFAVGARGQNMAPAFKDGMMLSTAQKSRSAAMVNSGSAANAIPQYGASTIESGYFAGGAGDTNVQGVAKL